MLILNNSLHFIARHFKQFSVPKVVISESDNIRCAAYYGWYTNTVYNIDGAEVYNSNGLIVISGSLPYTLEGTLLHEYRHHLQHEMHGKWYVPDWENGESVEEYHKSCWEVDARLFEASLGGLDEFTDEFKTPKMSRNDMLNLPSRSYLEGLLLIG